MPLLPNHNEKFAQFTAPCQARAEGWRTGCGIGLLVLFVAVFSYILQAYGLTILEMYRIGFGYQLVAEIAFQMTKRSVLLSLGAVAMILPMLWLVLKVVHRRGIGTLVGPKGSVNWRLFGAIFLVYGLVWLAIAGPGFWQGDFQAQLPLNVWLIWLAPTALLIFVQVLTEEFIFRGYVLQQFSLVFKSRWIWWVGPSLIFGLLHFNPLYYGDNAWIVCLNATLFGLILADVTIRSGTILPAVALHFANNFFQILVLGLPGVLSSTSLYLRSINLKDIDQTRAALLMSFAIMLLAYAIYLLVMRQRR